MTTGNPLREVFLEKSLFWLKWPRLRHKKCFKFHTDIHNIKEKEKEMILHTRAANQQQLSLCICKHDLSTNVLGYQKR